MKKSIFKSKTFWFNLLSIITAASGVIPLSPAVVGVVTGVINVALRAITTQPVGLSDGS
jgi:hypothetical protein